MFENPLAAPNDRRLADQFLAHFGLSAETPPVTLLRQVVAAFSQLPYENLTKILRQSERQSVVASRRGPDEVLGDHFQWGTGGTCFSLTAALLHLLRSFGWQAEPILADRRYGPNTHCALVVWIDGTPCLLDPGYLILDPIPLRSDQPRTIATAFNDLILTPQAGGKLELVTRNDGRSTYRLTFKTQPVDAGEFLKVWDESFDWDMMRYPVLTRVAGDRQLYLQGHKFQVRERDAVQRHELPDDELLAKIAREFGIAPNVAAKALRALEKPETTTSWPAPNLSNP